MSRQVGVEPTRQGKVDDYRGVGDIRPGIRVRCCDFLVIDGGYDYRRDVRQSRRKKRDGDTHRRRT